MKLVKNGFTIVELVIVISVIGILAAITTVAYNGTQDRARYAKHQTNLRRINDALIIYKSQNGAYPISSGSWAGTQSAAIRYEYQDSPTTSFIPALVPGYLDSMPSGFDDGYTYFYASSSTGSDYKLFRYCWSGTCPAIERTNNPLIDPLRPTSSWGYWSSDTAKNGY